MTRHRPHLLRSAAAAIVVSLVAPLAACGGGSEATGADPIVLEPAGEVGENPFTDSVAEAESAELPAPVVAAAVATVASAAADEQTGGVTTTGATPGLYGGTGDLAVCDVASLTTYLTDPANAEKAAAFAGVLGLAPDEIASALATFTPVVLTVDTLVTNHGFRDGRATAFPAVLQAGTAVLVDVTGTPRVKCGCGNPLTPPPTEIDLTDTTGDAWDGFDVATTATVTPSPTTLTIFVVTNMTTGEHEDLPAGGGGTGDAPPSTVPPAPAERYTINLTNVSVELLCGDPSQQVAIPQTSDRPAPVEVELDGDGIPDLVAIADCAPPTGDGEWWQTLVPIRGAADAFYIDVLGPAVQLPGVASALRVEGDTIVVDGHTFGPDDNEAMFCCPTVPTTTQWRWEGAWTQVDGSDPPTTDTGAPDIDLSALPDGLCGDGGDGAADTRPGLTAEMDVDGDGRAELLVVVNCVATGGNAQWRRVIAFADGPTVVGEPLDYRSDAGGAFAAEIHGLEVDGDVLVIDGKAFGPDDAHCCPTVATTTRWRPDGSGGWTEE